MKKLILAISALFLLAACGGSDDDMGTTTTDTKTETKDNTKDDSKSETKEEEKKDTVATDSHETAKVAVANMKVGWNLGNTLESNSNEVDGWIEKYTSGTPTDYETAWGQPVATQELIDMFKDAGFNAIRVPVTWWPHLDSSNNIDSEWMARVKEVVDYVINEGMYCILNVHHDTGDASSCWLKATDKNADFAVMNNRFVKIWKQIANTFKDYDEHLLFEAYNEMLDTTNSWNFAQYNGAYDAVNQYAQNFVNTVRATGGNNEYRNLIINTYAASAGAGNWDSRCKLPLSKLTMPEDTHSGHLAAEVHYYFSSYNTSDFDELFSRLQTNFLSKDVPVILGEYGYTFNDFNNRTSAEVEAAANSAKYIVSKAKSYGIATFYWMLLSDGDDRTVPTWTEPTVKDAIISGYNGN